MPFPAFWDSDRPLQPRGRSPDVTARAFPHPFARRLGVPWNKCARLPNLHEDAQSFIEKHDALVAQVRQWVETITNNLAVACGKRQPQGGERGSAPAPFMTHCATTLVHCMSGRGFLQNVPAKEDKINDTCWKELILITYFRVFHAVSNRRFSIDRSRA